MAERTPPTQSTAPRPMPAESSAPLDELLALLEREARMTERERALLARRAELSGGLAAEVDAAVDWSDHLRLRERALATRAESLLAWSAALDRVVQVPPAAPDGFWNALSERLGVVLAHELPELRATDVNEVVERALTAVGGRPRSRPPSAAPPAASEESGAGPSAIAEEAELLAGVGGPLASEAEPEEPPSMSAFVRALEDVLPDPPAPPAPPEPEHPVVEAPPALPSEPDAAPTGHGVDALAAFPAFDDDLLAELETPVPGGHRGDDPAAEDPLAAWDAPRFPASDPLAGVPDRPPEDASVAPETTTDAEAALMASILAEVNGASEPPPSEPALDEGAPVDEFASFAALSLELHSAIEQSVEAIAQRPSETVRFEADANSPPMRREDPPVPVGAAVSRPVAEEPRRDLSHAERELALRMTEEVHLTDDDIAGIFSGSGTERASFAFEMAAAPDEVMPPPAPSPPPASGTTAPPAANVSDDPFADLAAELEDFEPGLGAPADEHDLLLEPIPGYDLRVPEPTPAPPVVPAPAVSGPPPAAAQPRPVAPSEAPGVFRPTLGRVDRAARSSTPLPRVSRAPDRGAATFAALAAELDVGGVDPWRELDISDLRTAGHPGPLPTPAPQSRPTAAAERMRAERGHRAHLAVKVGVEYGTTFFTGFSGNISKGGVFVATHQTLPIGARVELFFEMPDGHAVSVPAVVRWVRDVDQATLDGSSPGIGLSFVSLTHDDAIILERYVAAHARSVLYDDENGAGHGG